MDFAEFKARIEKSRELDEEVAGVRFHLRLPSEHAWRIATEENTDASGNIRKQQVARRLLEDALFRWEGLKAEHLLKGAGEESVPFSREALAVLLDERQDFADGLVRILIRKLNQRRSQQEAARKNS